MPRLDLYTDYRLFVTVQLVEDEIHIGRGPECGVQLPDDRVSRNHAVIRRRGERHEIEDTSLNGTRLNDRILAKPTELAPGDRIYIEQFVLIYQPDGAPPEELGDRTTELDAPWPGRK